MKILIGLACVYSMILAYGATSQAASVKTNTAATGHGLMECGRYYFKANLTTLKNKSVFSNKAFGVVHFENPQAEAICGGDIVDTKQVVEDRGMAFGYSPPKFVQYKKVNSADAGLFDSRVLKVNQSYKIACGSRLVDAKVLEIYYGARSFVSFAFSNAKAEERCGQGRFHQMDKILNRSEKLH